MGSPSIGDLIIGRGATVRDALVIIDQNLQGIAFVLDESERLCGVITEGDIRRALLAGLSLEASVEKAMKRDCVWLPVGTPPEEIVRLLDGRIQVIPLVDEAGRPVDYASMQRNHRIPVMEPWLDGNELKYVVECIRTNWISSQGRFVQLFEEMFARFCGAKKAIAVSNGTAALHLALVSVGIGPGDEVIVPDLTFAASANAVIHAGASPVLVDVCPDTWTLDVAKVKAAITPHTRGVVAVHLYGHPCDMDAILGVAREHNLYVVEDCAEALGSMYRGGRVGVLGDVGCFSFFANKLITTGEGGMVVFKLSSFDTRARMLRDHGMSKERRYWHLEVGYNYRLTNLQAAVGVAQLERIGDFIKRRQEISNEYRGRLADVDGIVLPPALPWATNVHWLYPILIDEKRLGVSRDEVIERLALEGIETRPLFYPLHEMPPYRSLGSCASYPVAEYVSKVGLSLPSAPTLSSHDVEFICRVVKRITKQKGLGAKPIGGCMRK